MARSNRETKGVESGLLAGPGRSCRRVVPFLARVRRRLDQIIWYLRVSRRYRVFRHFWFHRPILIGRKGLPPPSGRSGFLRQAHCSP